MSKVEKLPSGCWEWRGNTNDRGYGQFFVQGKGYKDTGNQLSHRVSFMIANPEVELVTTDILCHTCDNPPCCNPEHLFVGTHMDNVRDSIEKGRHTSAKLSEVKVKEIYALYEKDTPMKELAAIYDVHVVSIRSIIAGRVWKDLHEEWVANGGGRKVREPKGPRKQMLILVPEEHFWQLKEVAARERMTQQDLVLEALKDKYGIGKEEEVVCNQ